MLLRHAGIIWLQDILEFIEDSLHGVVLFTFGSTVLMSSMPSYRRTAFLEALAQLPQRILMKYEGEMIDKPNNVMIRKWLPQRDILSKFISTDYNQNDQNDRFSGWWMTDLFRYTFTQHDVTYMPRRGKTCDNTTWLCVNTT